MSDDSVAEYKQHNYAFNDKEILAEHKRPFIFVFSFCVVLVVAIWVVRIFQFSITFRDDKISTTAADQFFNAAGNILWGPALLTIFVTLVSFYMMWWLWRDFGTYLCETRPGVEVPKGRQFRARAIMHEPPGDIFTLAGIGFTFVGLAVGLVTLSTDVIKQLTDHSDATGHAIAEAAVVFGSSLAVGLVSSLQGIFLAVCARRLAAQFSEPVRMPAEISRDFKHLQTMNAINGNLQQLLNRFVDDDKGSSSSGVKKFTDGVERALLEALDGEDAPEVDSTAAQTRTTAFNNVLRELRKKLSDQIRRDIPKMFQKELQALATGNAGRAPQASDKRPGQEETAA